MYFLHIPSTPLTGPFSVLYFLAHSSTRTLHLIRIIDGNIILLSYAINNFPYCEIRQLHQELLSLHLHVITFFQYSFVHTYFCKIGMETMDLVEQVYNSYCLYILCLH